jgi:hypothetical protein
MAASHHTVSISMVGILQRLIHFLSMDGVGASSCTPITVSFIISLYGTVLTNLSGCPQGPGSACGRAPISWVWVTSLPSLRLRSRVQRSSIMASDPSRQWPSRASPESGHDLRRFLDQAVHEERRGRWFGIPLDFGNDFPAETRVASTRQDKIQLSEDDGARASARVSVTLLTHVLVGLLPAVFAIFMSVGIQWAPIRSINVLTW